ncbi:MAG: S-ribosylhomocysteine lyase [Clostridiales bacterium]|jgi:S-ribosylhomocysteine lyase|nr:S-ribosylhomocysteine lyase [Clostridiales bacterium]
MKKIPSFQKDHRSIVPGFEVSMADKGITTFDLRFVKPNSGGYIPSDALHSIEHMLATALRNGRYKEHIVYFGPMGCRTGFYLLTSGLGYEKAKEALVEGIKACLDMEQVPGATEKECGNYREHDLAGAKEYLKKYLEAIGG